MTSTTTNVSSSRKPRRMTREPGASSTPSVSQSPADSPAQIGPGEEKPASKASIVLTMLARTEGATIEQIVDATGWQPHTTRAVLTGFRKKGHHVSSDKTDGVRTYRIASTASDVDSQPADARSKVDA